MCSDERLPGTPTAGVLRGEVAAEVGTAKSRDVFPPNAYTVLGFESGRADCERLRVTRVSMISTSSSRALSIIRTLESSTGSSDADERVRGGRMRCCMCNNLRGVTSPPVPARRGRTPATPREVLRVVGALAATVPPNSKDPTA